MKRKITLKTGGKVVITLMMIVLSFIIYSFLCDLGSYAAENRLGSIFICLGWFWLLVGQIMMIYAIWEE